VEYIHIIMITWRHFGKPEIVAVINNPILRASLQIRQLLTGRTGDRSKKWRNRAPSPRTSTMWSTITVVHNMGKVGRGRGAVEGDCNLIPASPWHQDGRRSTGCWPPATDDAAPTSTSRKW